MFLPSYNFLEEYKPESEMIALDDIRQSLIYKRKRYVDAMFFGELLELKRHGQGVMLYKTGRVYEGEWLNDLRHGKGYEKYHNGNIYLGMFDTGKAHG